MELHRFYFIFFFFFFLSSFIQKLYTIFTISSSATNAIAQKYEKYQKYVRSFFNIHSYSGQGVCVHEATVVTVLTALKMKKKIVSSGTFLAVIFGLLFFFFSRYPQIPADIRAVPEYTNTRVKNRVVFGNDQFYTVRKKHCNIRTIICGLSSSPRVGHVFFIYW